MNIKDLFEVLKKMGTPLELKASDEQLPKEFQAFIATIPEKSVKITIGADGLVLQGEVITIKGATENKWKVQGLAKANLSLSHITITIDGSKEKPVFTGKAQAKMPFKSGDPVAVLSTALKEKENPWDIKLAENTSGISALDVILLSKDQGLPFPIPAGMDFLSEALVVDKDKFDIIYYPNSEIDAYTQFTLNAPAASWTAVPDVFAFKGLDIEALVKKDSINIVIIGHLKIGTVGVDVGISMSGDKSWYVLVKPTAPATVFPGLAALASWIGGKELDTSVTDGFKSVNISTNGFDAAISYIDASVDIGKKKLNYLNIKSLLSIGKLQLDVNFHLPELTIKGGLHDKKPLKIADLLSSLSLSPDTVPDDLTVSTADFSADLGNSLYSIELEVNNLWKAGPFSFEKIGLSLDYNGSEGLSGTFSCQFAIADKAEILLQAAYGGKENGWVFSGGLAPDTVFKIGDVIDILAKDFGITSIPQPIKSLELTKLYLSYTSATSSFEFNCEGDFLVDDVNVKMVVVIKLNKVEPKGYHAFFSGKITIDKLVFDVVFDTTNMKTNVFIAAYHNTGDGDIPLHDLIKGVSENMASFIPESLKIQLKEVKFIYLKEDTVKQFAFGMQLNASVNLKDLPVIGKKLPDGMTVSIEDFQVLFASAAFSDKQVKLINPLLPKGILPLTKEGLLKGLLVAGNLDIAGHVIAINTGKKKEVAPPKSERFAFTGAAPLTAGSAVAPSDITWFNVNKQLGPMKFERLGVAFAKGNLSFAMDASLTMGPASLAMQGLTVSSPLSKFDPSFGIQGFFMSLKTASLELGGGFLKSTSDEGVDSYYGIVLAKVGTLSLKALGGDTPAHEAQDPKYPKDPTKKIHVPASFFIYANIQAPLGGPPFLYVNGFAGGFGINNTLKLPTLENLPGYILLPGPGSKAPVQGKGPEDTIKSVLPQMQQYFIPEPGQYWMAAGIAFSSFQMINAFALVTVSFGVEFQVALLGSCSMTFPTGAPTPVAYVEINIMASFSPSTGRLAVEGILSPASYIFGSFCQITGGFAFYIWFNPPVKVDGPKTGDFVVTLGGYHPAFRAPVYYPVVPRLGINFNLGPLQVIGQCYFALTPGMFMAGFSMKATWDMSIIKAWFAMGADFLIAWAPFHYEAIAYVNIGCSVDLGLFTINVSIGAELELWGPPFGGEAEIDLDVISFTIAFGQPQVAPEPVGWLSFKKQFLPADNPAPVKLKAGKATANEVKLFTAEGPANVTNVLKATIKTGLNGSDVNGQNWILDPDHFNIHILSTLPVNKPQWATSGTAFKEISNLPGSYNVEPPPVIAAGWPYLIFKNKSEQMDDTHIWNEEVNIKPMSLKKVQSTLSMVVTKMTAQGSFTTYVIALTLQPEVGATPGALFESPGEKPKPKDPAFLKSSLNGFSIMPLPRVPNVVNGILLIQLLYQQGNDYYFNYQQRVVNNTYKVSSSGADTDVLTINVTGAHAASLLNKDFVLNSIKDQWVAGQRSDILKNLNLIGFDTYQEAVLDTFATDTALTDWPEVMLLADTLPES